MDSEPNEINNLGASGLGPDVKHRIQSMLLRHEVRHQRERLRLDLVELSKPEHLPIAQAVVRDLAHCWTQLSESSL